MPGAKRSTRKDSGNNRIPRVRNILFKSGPRRLTGGRFSRQTSTRNVVVRVVETSSPVWPEAFDGLRIAHLSDCHLGGMMSLENTESMVREIASREPDFIAGTGNVVDLQDPHSRTLIEALANIGAPLGTAMVLSSDDERHDLHETLQIVKDAGLILLGNETVQISRNGAKLHVAGIRGATSAAKCESFVEQSCNGFAHLLLAHNPKVFGKAAEFDIPLTLSGHTNHGNIALHTGPGQNPLPGASRHRYEVFENGPSRLGVTIGGGDRKSPRKSCPAVFTMITMRHASQAYIIEDEPPKRKRRRKRKAP